MGDTISRSWAILSAQPLMVLPQLIAAVPMILGDIFRTSQLFSPFGLVTLILSIVLSVTSSGAYPFLVKEAMDGRQLTVTEALGRAYHRFWTLLAAGILVVLVVFLGVIALIVPGIIFATWYAYTAPAIMLGDKGALEGMSASKAFGRDKKGSTFSIFLIFVLVTIVLAIAEAIFSVASPPLGQLVYALLSAGLSAWSSVAFSYVYIVYGPSPVATTTGTAGYGMGSPAPPQPAVMGIPPAGTSGGFCRFCGSPVSADSKFCASCGKPV